MAISYKIQPASNYLAGNPIVFDLNATTQELITFSVVIGGATIFSGSAIPTGIGNPYNVRIIVEDVLNSYLPESAVSNMSQLVSAVTNSRIAVTIQFVQGSSTLTYLGTIYKGGIGKKMLRYLKGKGTDIFAYKLLNTEKQFFLTTRTTGRHIVIKENELYPLCFIAVVDKAYTVVTEYGSTFTFPAMTAGNLYAFNIEVLRQLSYNTYRKIPSFLGILVDGKYVLDITIKKPAKAPNKYTIRFLNSFSAFEKMEVTGRKVSEPEFAEDNAFMIYDQAVDDYIEQNNRQSLREVINADFGYKSLEEFLFMRDMLQSNKRYLADSDGNEYEVRVSAENFSHDLFPTEPGSAQLKIRLVDNDSNYSAEIDESAPDFNFGEAIWISGVTNGYGFLYADSTLNTI
jgi:hypothetical protein